MLHNLSYPLINVTKSLYSCLYCRAKLYLVSREKEGLELELEQEKEKQIILLTRIQIQEEKEDEEHYTGRHMDKYIKFSPNKHDNSISKIAHRILIPSRHLYLLISLLIWYSPQTLPSIFINLKFKVFYID